MQDESDLDIQDKTSETKPITDVTSNMAGDATSHTAGAVQLAESDEDDTVDSLASSAALSEAERRAAELSEEEKQQRILILKPIVEGALMAAGEALKLTKIQSLFEEHEMPSKGLLLEAMALIKTDCDGRGFTLVEVASGWRFQVREDYAQWVNRLWDERPQKYSRALLETLALVAYRQPITRGDIEEVRGVAVSSHIMKTLTEREWVKVVGHRDVPGRPALYATTRQFLDYFNMKSLDELPTLGELKDVDSLNEALQLDEILGDDVSHETEDAEALVQNAGLGDDAPSAETRDQPLADPEQPDSRSILDEPSSTPTTEDASLTEHDDDDDAGAMVAGYGNEADEGSVSSGKSLFDDNGDTDHDDTIPRFDAEHKKEIDDE